MVVYYNGDKVSATPKIPKVLSKKSVLFMKPKNFMDMLTLEDLQKKVLCFELSEHHLAQLQLISSEVFFPLLSNPLNRSTWSGPTSKEVMLKFSSFLANLTITVGQSRVRTDTRRAGQGSGEISSAVWFCVYLCVFVSAFCV